DVIRNKTLLDGAGMPDKLRDCTSKDRSQRELFIVEGDSAGGPAVAARNPGTQAILPIRGKILNVERARMDRMLKNLEIQAIIAANPDHKKDFQRLKGLGEMDWQELQVTTMDPDHRTLLQVTVEDAVLADAAIAKLMGEDVESRKQFIVTNADDVRFLDI